MCVFTEQLNKEYLQDSLKVSSPSKRQNYFSQFNLIVNFTEKAAKLYLLLFKSKRCVVGYTAGVGKLQAGPVRATIGRPGTQLPGESGGSACG